MAGKKHKQSKSTKQQSSDSIPGKPLPEKKANHHQSFWKRLLENEPRLFLYRKICIFMVAFLVFANGIPNGFNLDDVYYTTEVNPIANMGLKAIPTIFTSHTLSDNSNNTFEYRPITMLSFAIQHQFLGYAPATSHFISVLLYSFICLLVFVLLCLWFGPSNSWFAFFVTLLYTVHPLHTEVVDNIKNRDELLATFFCLLSMISIWKWHTTDKTRHFVLSVLLFITGILCKPTIATYITIIPISFYFFTNMPFRKIVLPFVILSVSFIVFWIVKDYLLPEQKRIFYFFENPMYVTNVPLGVKTATASYILGWYLYLHILPYPLSFYYGYKYVELLNWGNLLPVLSLIPFLLLIYLVVKKSRKKSIVAFGALFYLVCILPYSNLFGLVPGMMAERFTFMSSLGYCILLASLLCYLFKIIPGVFSINKNSKYLLATFLLFFISYTGMSIVRNTLWESNWILFSHDIKHLQNSAKANTLYGELVISKINKYRNEFNQAPDAEKEIYRDSILQYQDEEKPPFLRALAIDPDYDNALNNLALSYLNEDSLELAKKYLLRARTLMPNDPSIRCTLGITYEFLGDNNSSFIDSSINEFKTVISINPKYATAYDELSQIYLRKKDTVSAINNYSLGIKNIPDKSLLYIQLARVYLFKQDSAKAIYYFERGAEVPHPDPRIFQILLNYYHSKNDMQKENYYRNKATMLSAETNHDN